MFRNLKALGLGLAAVFALSAAMASSASAETIADFHSHSETGNTILTGHQEGTNTFTVLNTKGNPVSVTCPTATVEGTQEGSTATEVTVHPIYGGEEKVCQIKVGETNFGKAKVVTAGCNYEFSADTTTTEPEEEEHAKVWVECDKEKAIEIIGPLGCTITVGEQGPLHGVRYSNENETSDRSIVVNATVSNIEYTATSACSLINVVSNNNGVYEGGFTVEGYKDEGGEEKGRTGIWWEATP